MSKHIHIFTIGRNYRNCRIFTAKASQQAAGGNIDDHTESRLATSAEV